MKKAFLLVVFTACGPALSEAGAGVKVMNSDPAPNCEEIGHVSGSLARRDRVERAKNEMRNEAARMGANYVRLEGVDGAFGSSANGTAYKCP